MNLQESAADHSAEPHIDRSKRDIVYFQAQCGGCAHARVWHGVDGCEWCQPKYTCHVFADNGPIGLGLKLGVDTDES